MSIKKSLAEIFEKSLKKMNINKNIDDIIIEIPKDKNNGDYSTNLALTLTKELHKSPMDISNSIIDNIEDNDIIDTLSIAAPGFINITIKKEYLLNNITNILKEKRDYGKSTYGNNIKINLEYVSANPTGTLHIGHGRGATYGDNLSRILKKIGYDVTREYYINDAGNQMNNLGISIKER